MLKEILKEIERIEERNKIDDMRQGKSAKDGYITCIETFPKHTKTPIFIKNKKYKVVSNHPGSIYISDDLGYKKMFKKNEVLDMYNPIRANMDISYNHPVEIFFNNDEVLEIPIEKIPN